MGNNEPESWPGDSTPGWDATDEASWQSFPASDPPAGCMIRVGRGICREKAPEPEQCRVEAQVLDEAEQRALREAQDDEPRH